MELDARDYVLNLAVDQRQGPAREGVPQDPADVLAGGGASSYRRSLFGKGPASSVQRGTVSLVQPWAVPAAGPCSARPTRIPRGAIRPRGTHGFEPLYGLGRASAAHDAAWTAGARRSGRAARAASAHGHVWRHRVSHASIAHRPAGVQAQHAPHHCSRLTQLPFSGCLGGAAARRRLPCTVQCT